MKTLFFHPTGNANVRAASLGLANAGILSAFYTSIATFPGSTLDKLGSFGPFSELKRRSFSSKIESVTTTWPWYELGRILSAKAGFQKLVKHEKGMFCVDEVYRALDRKVSSDLKKAAKRGVKAVYGYEDGAEFAFTEAKKQNLNCFYDLPIGYWRAARRLLENEHIRWPEWSATLTGFQDSETKLLRKDEELRLADKIFVASKFTAHTLRDFPGKLAPVEVIPYGFPPVIDYKNYVAKSASGKLKVLFVGGLSQRKGIADLFAAVEGLKNHVELTVVGNKMNADCPALDAALAKHKWIPSLPHHDVLQLMRSQDILVFPSLFEGFGLVISEAMSQGTPVITTDRTAGPDLIVDGENGWLIEAGSKNALQSSIEKILLSPSTVKEAGKQALATAASRPWWVYGKELAEAIIRN